MNWPKVDTQSFLAIVLVLAIIALVFAILLIGSVPNDDTFKVIVGGLMTVGFATVINFYFGSSSGSKAKDDTMQQAVNNLTASKNGNGDQNGGHQ